MNLSDKVKMATNVIEKILHDIFSEKIRFAIIIYKDDYIVYGSNVDEKFNSFALGKLSASMLTNENNGTRH